MIVHCLFEQSGTFKNAFKKYGIEAYDYDIQNEFGETDYVTDLFKEIEGGYQGEPSLFDKISPDDLIFAFFPCIRFENQIMLWFRGQSASQKKWSLEEKCEFDMNLLKEVSLMYDLVNKMFIICIRKGLKLVMENPYSEEHFLRRYWCYSPAVIDRDRRDSGDYFKKPTQYWLLNCEPQNNLIFEPISYNANDMVDSIKNDTLYIGYVYPMETSVSDTDTVSECQTVSNHLSKRRMQIRIRLKSSKNSKEI